MRETAVEVGKGWTEMNIKEPVKSEDRWDRDGKRKLRKPNPGSSIKPGEGLMVSWHRVHGMDRTKHGR